MSVPESSAEGSSANDGRSSSGARSRAPRALALVCALALTAVVALAFREPWSTARELMLSRGTGWLALLSLLASMSVRPWTRLRARLRGGSDSAPLAWRRLLGMASAWLALLHAALSFSTTLAADTQALVSWPHLRAGLAALAILCALLLTSYPSWIVRLRLRLWPELHRLVYAAALLVLQHLLLAPFAPRLFTLALFGATFLFGLLRWL